MEHVYHTIDVTGNSPKAFLTETRKGVLDGDWEGSDSTHRSHKSDIRQKSKAAIEELIEVAESREIDNKQVFDPEQIRHLLVAIAQPGGLVEDEYEHASEEFRNELYFEVNRFLLGFQPEDSPTAEPPEETPDEDTDGTRVTCHSCDYEWLYQGSAAKATCPSCANKTPVAGE